MLARAAAACSSGSSLKLRCRSSTASGYSLNASQQPLQVAARIRVVLEAGGKLREQARRACRLRQSDRWRARKPSMSARRRVDDGSWPVAAVEHLRMGELLIELQRELEVTRACARPSPSSCSARARRRSSSSPRPYRSARRKTRSSSKPPSSFRDPGAGGIEHAVPRASSGRIVPA